MLASMKVNGKNMRLAAARGFINATDLADWLVEKKAVPFRTAYKLVGQLVGRCVKAGLTLEELPLEVYRSYSPLFGEDLYDEIDLRHCVEKRTSAGGTSPASVEAQIKYVKEMLSDGKDIH